MNANAVLQLGLFFLLLVAAAIPLGGYMARVYSGNARWAGRLFGPIERTLYRLSGARADEQMTWKRYAAAALLFNLLGTLVVYALGRLQAFLPLNPAGHTAVRPEVAFNTAVSFATNTNWQAYSGEATMSYLTQMLALGVQNFLSAATGMAVLVALIRGLTRRSAEGLGSFWVDLTRTTLYILLPLSFALALVLVSQGVVQTFSGPVSAALIDPILKDGSAITRQIIALGPAASQIAIKQLGTNGGGFFNANSAHPFENPTPLSNLLELLAILLIPAALCFTFGALVKDRRQGWALFATMLVLFVPLLVATVMFEQAGNPALSSLASIRPRAPYSPEATWRARSCVSGSPTAPSGPRQRPRRRMVPSMRCTTASRRSAASSRCGSSSLAKSCSGALAPVCTAC
jgi:K+-transporting ATPase ATPase A chain